ncbi:uncharacterized protein N7459_006117 [Penicillium hispanicum]|uniref:uncharacterized protein n=1 Tax=Penicillium hispanicum TaxID=1080232 RepID=UPI00253FAEF4|nr:uncharacterized protein N7459_006117 [Penicillium hispanicum]KAJ5580132.1 hypothetical protein N7459_006117 [Penicillium hispanicum]
MPPKRPGAFYKVLKDWGEWAAAAKDLDVYYNTISQKEALNSGSEITRQEYLLLKVIWPGLRSGTDRELKELRLYQYFQKAEEWLDSYPPYSKYLKSIQEKGIVEHFHPNKPNSDPFSLGVFELPRTEQLQILKASMTRGKIDEDTVNASFIAFLSAITVRNRDGRCFWTPHRAGLTAKFKKSSIEARLDGYLASRSTSEVRALIEVKPQKRERHEPYVSMQETAEMVSWLPPSSDRAYLISQNGMCLYLTVAEFGQEWLDYLHGDRRTLPQKDFMKMMHFGAWDIDEASDIDRFAKLILAIVLRVSDEDKN